MTLGPLEMLFALLVGHAIADYPLQGEYLARNKNPVIPISAGGVPWYHAMGAHALIHGGFVFVITGSVVLGVAETLSHAGIDLMKCVGWLSIHEDQGLHVICKLFWIAVVFA